MNHLDEAIKSIDKAIFWSKVTIGLLVFSFVAQCVAIFARLMVIYG